MHSVREFTGHQSPILKFLVAGDFIFSLEQSGALLIFNRKSANLERTLKFEATFDLFSHPTTYVNKLLFSGTMSSEEPVLELWNVIENKKLCSFP